MFIKSICAIFIIFLTSFAPVSGADLYKISVESNTSAGYLNSLTIQPVMQLHDGYLILCDKQNYDLIQQSSIDIKLIASNVDVDELSIDLRRDKSNAQKYPVLFEQGDVRIFNIDAKSISTGDISPIVRTPEKIIYTPYQALNPDYTLGNIDLQWLIDQIEQDSVEAYLYRLEAFYRRLTGTDSCFASADWIADKFASFGYDSIYYDPFTGSQLWDRHLVPSVNIVCTKLGTLFPDYQIIVGGHFDAVPDCPGADDDGTGTAGTLEIARILADIETEVTFVFIAFDSEESWMWGSYHYMDEAAARGDKILYMMNLDMIGHWTNDDWADLYYGASITYSELWKVLADSLVGIHGDLSGSTASDHLPFQEAGIPVTFVQEYFFSDNYHYPSDSTSYINFEYMTRMIKASIATVAVISEAPISVEIESVFDVGNGHAIRINWSHDLIADVDFFRIYYNTNPPTGLDFVDVDGSFTGYTIEGLTTGQEYTIYIDAYDSDGNRSFLRHPVNVTPYLYPQAPTGVTARPLLRSIEINWNSENAELDFSHYMILRDEVPLPVTLTAGPYIDNDVNLGADFHSYRVAAVDNDGYISDLAGIEPQITRAATLEPGTVLGINRSSNLATSIVNEAVTGQFIRDALTPFNFDYYSDSAYTSKPANERLGLYDLLDYELLVLGGESAREDDFGASITMGGILEDIEYYISLGGKVIIFGRWGDFKTGPSEYQNDYFNEGNSDYNYNALFHIDTRTKFVHTIDVTTMYSDLIGAHSNLPGYPALSWDSLAAVDHSSPWVEVSGIPCPTFVDLGYSGSDLDILYTYDSRTDAYQAENKPIAWRYLGDDYQYIFFEMPLTFFDHSTALTVMQTAITELLSVGSAGEVLFEPQVIDVDNLPTLVEIYLGNFENGKTAADVDVSSILLNGSLSPVSTTILPTYSYFTGEVLNLEFNAADVLATYGQVDYSGSYSYITSWQFTGEGESNSAAGYVTLIAESQVLIGDANGDGDVNVGDAVYLINHVFRGGLPPVPLEAGDANCDGSVNVGDAVYLINHVFKGGPGPCE
ncbi:MAG: M28 family peptidase [candidate division Zixibacteria bacterium]